MNPRRAIGIVLISCFVAAAIWYPAPAASKGTDTSDIWWIHTESGWGIQLVQNNYTIFATLFVYGPDGQPTWYTATLTYQGSYNWNGPLYKTTGPWFGAPLFDPSNVTVTAVGVMSFNMPTIDFGTLIYTVNGVQVLKKIERQLLVYEDFNGTFSGVMNQIGTGLACSPAENVNGASTTFTITQSGTAMTIVTKALGDTCTFPGTYSQAGHFGRLTGTYLCVSGANGMFDFVEMVRNSYDLRMRTKLTPAADCTITGHMVGLQPEQ
jgi:hypothetical protein